MLKNLINAILNLFGAGNKEQASNDWSAGDYDNYTARKDDARKEHLAQKEKEDGGSDKA